MGCVKSVHVGPNGELVFKAFDFQGLLEGVAEELDVFLVLGVLQTNQKLVHGDLVDSQTSVLGIHWNGSQTILELESSAASTHDLKAWTVLQSPQCPL